MICTGRADYPNQVNNVLCFPFIFRGALDVGASAINEEMKHAAVEAIAQLAPIANSRASDGRVRQNLAFSYAMAGDLENALQVSRKDLDEQSAQRQLSYFMQLKALPPEMRSAELRRNPSFFPQSGTGA